MTELSAIFERGFEAVEADDLEGVRRAIDQAAGARPDDPRLEYLKLVAVWLDDEDTTEFDDFMAGVSDVLEGAVKLDSPAEAGRIVLELGDMLATFGEPDEAEVALGKLCERGDLDVELATDARLLHAQILLEAHEDPEEAKAVLDGVDESRRDDPGYVSMRAAVLMDLGEPEQGLALLRAAVERGDDLEHRYQLGLMLSDLDHRQEAIEHFLEVRKRDLVRHEVNPDAPVPEAEVEDLRRHFEDLLDTLPNPALAKLGTARIEVRRWVSEAQIGAGTDPRAPLAFTELRGEGDSLEVQTITLFRDSIVAQIIDDDEIEDVLGLGLVEELDRVFDLELIPGS